MNTSPHSRLDGGTASRRDPLTCALAIVTLIGVATIAVICITVQFLRTDLEWIGVAMSLYVIGPYGGWVQASFFAPAPGIAALGIAWHRALGRHARNIAPLVLFAVAAIALCIAAANAPDKGDQPITLHGQVHEWATFATFVCLTTAMLVQSVRLQLDPRWRAYFPAAITIASVALGYFWIFALLKPARAGREDGDRRDPAVAVARGMVAGARHASLIMHCKQPVSLHPGYQPRVACALSERLSGQSARRLCRRTRL